MRAVEFITEARSHLELNRKFESGKMELYRWIVDNIPQSRNTWGVSMTMLPKLGINPQRGASDDTPKGIYFYPLWWLSTWINNKEELPWGNDFPYIQLFQYDIRNQLTRQTQIDPARVKQALRKYCPEEIIEQTVDNNNDPYWYIYNCLVQLGKGDETTIVLWNKVLRDLGFTSVIDEGKGWIATNEPAQGIILDPRIIKQVKTFSNYQRQINEDRDQDAAGIVLYAEDTGRYGLQQRSNDISDPGLWAAWGGGREPSESLEQCAKRELMEESGYTGPVKLKRIGENSKYVTFLGTIPHEFEPRANPEWQDYCWVEAGDWPAPMHPGVAAALKNIPVKHSVDEAFDQPYKSKWETSEYGDVDANTKLPDGTYLNIMFNQEYDGEGNEVIQVDFHRNNSQEVTGEGDAQRIFATVLAAIQKYIKKYKPQNLIFSASKEVDPGQNSESRAKLYNRLVQRYASSWGYQSQHSDDGDAVRYQLTRTVSENFADGKVKGKSRPGRVKRAGASCNGSVTDLRHRAKNASGEKAKMYHWCANMKSGKKK